MKLYLATAVFLGLAATTSLAAGPVETNHYAVQGVVMDEHAVSANAAKDKALLLVQQTALVKLGENLGGDEVSLAFARLSTKEVLPLLKSLSIEEESISPGHYEGDLPVRCMPDKVKPF